MTWTGQVFSVGQILTAAQQNNLQADITAVANGDAGAPNITQSGLGANAVGQGELKDAVQQTTGSVGTGDYINILFTGGTYSLGWGIAGGTFIVHGYDVASFAAGIKVRNNDPATQAYYFQARFLQASPPYNLGYGDIPLFIFALIDNNTNEILAVDTAPDAPWHYNGPTDVKAKIYKDGKSFRYCKPVELELYNRDVNLLLPNERTDVVSRLKQESSTELLEITQDIKNADMDIVQHPFIGSNLIGKTVVLLDPCSNLCEELFFMRELGENTNELFMKNKFVLDSTPLDVRSPSGVITVPFKQRNTK